MTKFHELTIRYPQPPEHSKANRLGARVADVWDRFLAELRAVEGLPEPEVVDRVVVTKARAEIVAARNAKGPTLVPALPASEDPDAAALAAIREAMAPGAGGGSAAPGRKSHATRVVEQGAAA